MVLSHLAAAEGVGKRVQSVDASGDQMLVLLHQRGCDAVDTAHGGDDPEFVAHGGTPVFAAVALKGSGLYRRQWIDPMIVCIVRTLAESGAHVMDMDPGSRRDLCLCNADRIAVLDDGFALADRTQGNLMPPGDVLCSSNLLTVCRQLFAHGDISQCHRHIV